MADEKPSWWRGPRIYIAVTAAFGCFLGVGLSTSADTNDLAAAYGEFADAARAHQPDYQPETVNGAGWEATQMAWQRLFPGMVVMRCFLHVVLGIQPRGRANQPLYQALTEDLWQLFHRLNPAQFGQRLRRLGEWVKAEPEIPPVLRLLSTADVQVNPF
jgi:hypothetical protein